MTERGGVGGEMGIFGGGVEGRLGMVYFMDLTG